MVIKVILRYLSGRTTYRKYCLSITGLQIISISLNLNLPKRLQKNKTNPPPIDHNTTINGSANTKEFHSNANYYHNFVIVGGAVTNTQLRCPRYKYDNIFDGQSLRKPQFIKNII